MLLVASLLLLAAPASDDRFIHFLNGIAVGEIRLTRKGGHYTYVSQHYFRNGATAIERFSPSGSDNPTWASESLLKPRPLGCWAVEDEVTRQKGQACVTQVGNPTRGTLFGAEFTAVYDRGALQQLTLGDSGFTRREVAVKFADPFAEGILLSGSGGALALTPPVAGARPALPKPSGQSEDCLAAANAWVKEHSEYEVVLGLIDDGKHGWPHAWVKHRTTQEELDPSRPQSQSASPRYLALPGGTAGLVYLDLLAKRRTLRRVAAP